MNFFVDAYDFILTSIYQVIGTVAIFDCAFYALLILFFIKKMGGKKFFFWRLRSLNPLTEKDKGPFKNKKFRFFSDLVFISSLIYLVVKLPVYVKFFNPFEESYVDKYTDSSYFLERDRKFIRASETGLILMPYAWMPIAILTNKFRQWVDTETMVTWIYHDERRECINSDYTERCGYAMNMARALHRDDESLKIGKEFVKARKGSTTYRYCMAMRSLRAHAEETDNVEMYKDLEKKRCELGCIDDCWRHEHAQSASTFEIKRKFQNRASISSFLR